MSKLNFFRKLVLFFLGIQTGIAAMGNTNEISNENFIINYGVNSRATFSGGENTPFWMVSNLYGLGSPEFNNGYVRGWIEKPVQTDHKFSWGVTADLVGQWNLPASFRIQQLFAEIKYRALWVSFGAREYKPLYNDLSLSSGDLLFSGNSLPVPQLRIGTYGFAPFWGTKGWLSVNAYLSYGMFTDSKWERKWVEPGGHRAANVLYCSKGIWLRIGKPSIFPLTFDFGVELGTQFGGTIYKKDGDMIKMPTNLKAWFKALVPMPGGKDTPEGEQINIEGNFTGEYTLSLSYSPTPQWNIRPYYEHFFEDHSQMFFEYGAWKDGLWGIEVTFPRNKFVSKFVYEYISTYDQSGAVLNNYSPEIPEQVSGRDSYYTHYLYGGWQTWGMTIGTPLATSPLYNRSHTLTLYNTRFFANHIGLEGNPVNSINWRLLLTFSRNYGTYYRPLPDIMNNTSGLFEVTYSPVKVPGLWIKGAVAFDKGKLLGNNFGGFISLGYQGAFHIASKKKF